MQKILKLYLFPITFPITISAIIASNLGIITNLIYELGGRHREALWIQLSDRSCGSHFYDDGKDGFYCEK